MGTRMRRFVTTVMIGILVVGGLQVAGSMTASAGAAEAYDGSSAAKAAPSCWWIHEISPSSPSGLYWLRTQTSIAPEQFFCDMVTAGGGWVLVGRGREGWSFAAAGQRSAADIRTNPSGTNAFPPAALPSTVIDGLLDGQRVSDLEDGILIRRAANLEGTAYQNVVWRTLDVDTWTWAMAAGQRLASSTVDGTTYVGGNTKDGSLTFAGQVGPGTGSANNGQRMFTWPWASHKSLAGFAYGRTVAGTNTATSYLWTATTEGHALPFAQVMIRPRIAPGTPPPIPTTGLPATTLPPVMSSATTSLNGWGVTGLLETGDSEPAVDTQVQAITQAGETMYVGGKFATVQQGSAGTPTAQPYLAAFDRATGNWVSSFRPVLDGTVWDLATTPDGNIILAGQFSSVNGAPGTAGLAMIDPQGNVVPTWSASLTAGGITGQRPFARTVKIVGNAVYVGGLFTRITSAAGPTSVSQIARLSLATGRPDPSFRPVIDQQVYDIDATATRVWAVGDFATVNGVSSPGVAIFDPDGTPSQAQEPYQPTSAARPYQQTVLALGSDVIIGGSEHNLNIYDQGDFSVRRRWVTADIGGDFQATAAADGIIYASTHATRFMYRDAHVWPDLTGYTTADKVLFVAAVDAATREVLPGFVPNLTSANAEGVWELYVDSAKCLWVGGDMSAGTGGSWLGGFGKLCQLDSTAPSTPTGATASIGVAGGGNKLSWTAATDNVGTPKYEILKNDRVIAGNYGATSYTDPAGTAQDVYFVRAIDARGNRSATTTGLVPTDVTKPSAPTGLAGTGGTGTADLTWTASTDNVGVTGYNVYRNGTLIGTSPTPGFTDSGRPAATYAYQVAAVDAAGNVSAKTASVNVVVTGPDVTKPSAPTGLAATVNAGTVSLTWTAAKDDRGVTGYNVYRNGTLIGASPTPGYADGGRPAGTFSYQVAAVDAAGNVSNKTASLAVTT